MKWSFSLPKNRFTRAVAVMVGGTVGAQAIAVLAAPLLTRFYTPQDFGLLAVFVALLSLVSVVACLRYELMIPVPEDDNQAAALCVLSLAIVFVVTALVTVPILLFRHAIAGMLNTPGVADYLYLLPLATAFVGVFNILNYLAIREKAFSPLAKTKIAQSLSIVAIQLGGAPFGTIALLAGQISGYVTGTFSLGLRSIRASWSSIKKVRFADLQGVAKRYKNAPLFSTWSALFNSAGMQLPPIMFAALFSPAAAGMFALANRVLSMPMQLLGKSIGNVFFSASAKAQREGKLGLLVKSVHGRLAHIGMPPILAILIAGPDMFSIIFGEPWRQAGVFAQWMAPWLYLVFVTSPLSTLFEVLDRQASGMVFQAILLIVRSSAIAVGAAVGDLPTAIALFGIGSAACWLGNLAWSLRICGNSWTDIWQPTASAIAWGMALVSPLIFTMTWSAPQTYWIASFAVASVLIAVRYAYLMKSVWI